LERHHAPLGEDRRLWSAPHLALPRVGNRVPWRVARRREVPGLVAGPIQWQRVQPLSADRLLATSRDGSVAAGPGRSSIFLDSEDRGYRGDFLAGVDAHYPHACRIPALARNIPRGQPHDDSRG